MTQWTWKTASFLKHVEPMPQKFGRCCRNGISPLIWRIPILVWAVSIISWSVASFWGPLEMYFLYMTHWGLLLIVIESVFGIIATVKKTRMGYIAGMSGMFAAWNTDGFHAVLRKRVASLWQRVRGSTNALLRVIADRVDSPILKDATYGLPWYVKTYWVLYNVTIPVAFLVTVFYWGILKTSGKIEKYAPNPVLDVMLHGGNSVSMLIELLLSAHPSRLLHIFQPLFFALAYLLFTVAYYFAGGLDPWGNAFIYPVIDWSKPDQTAVVVALTALFLALMHLVVVAIAATRDAIARRFRSPAGIYNDGFGEES